MVPNASIQRAEFRINRFYCNGRISNELQGESDITVAQQGSQLLALQFRKVGARGSTLLSVDQQRSILSRVDQYQPKRPLAYTPYGHHSPVSGYLGFNGERLDSVTLHYLLGNGYRGFNPVLMRFNSSDNMSPFGQGGLNSYAYCQGDPVNLHDPSGHFALGKFFSRIFRAFSGKSKPKTVPQGTQMGAAQSSTTDLSIGMSSYRRPRSKSLSSQPVRPPSVNDVNGWDLIGFHGSSSEHAKSLMSGLDPRKMGANGLTMGEGFYASITPDIPGFMARNSVIGRGGEPQIFGVYTQNQARLKPGLDFKFGVRGKVPQNRNQLEIVIQKEAYNLVVVRVADVRSKVSLPRAYEAPF
ncbi:RHS repeat-associated core domain-containing protein [Pseudomonas sp. 10-1B]|uniref:RHS repeat-associated core domain-containing protein n=1 Tax=Pseudomonas sp. 10-1B TaxID=1546029 RepID=UPI0009E22455|nr:RHS repeat-associated core domain-containing protein [Pseudomonas sp. 10-1B]